MTENRSLLSAHIAVFFMGMASVVAEASGFEPWRTTSYRVTFGCFALVLFFLIRKQRAPLPRFTDFLLFLLGGVLLSIHWFAFFKSIRLLGVMLGNVLIGVEPIIIALMGRAVLKEPLSRRTILGLVFSSLGFVVLGLGGRGDQEALWEGVAWSVFAFVLFGFLVMANRRWVQKTSPILVTATEMLGAIPLTLMFTPGPWLPQDSLSWVFALALGLLCTGLAYALYNSSMRKLTASFVGILLSLEVVYGLLGGWVLGDSLTLHQALAAILISSILIMDLGAFLLAKRRAMLAGEHPYGPAPVMPQNEDEP